LVKFILRKSLLTFLLALGFAAVLPAQTVRFSISEGSTPAGTIDVQLNPAAAPNTVANFLSYISSGAYTNSIIHRAAYANGAPFIIQGGGFQFTNNAVVTTPTNAAIKNEFNLSNVRGTIAMALNATSIDSASDEWFFNVSNNSTSLDSQSFTVFGTIVGTAGFKLMDAISVLQEYDESAINGAFNTIPLVNYTSGTPDATNYVLVTSIVVLPEPTQLGVVNAASGAASLLNGISPGELLTIYGQASLGSLASIGPATGVGFNTSPVSTTLGNTQVLFNGTPGPMMYASGGQTNVVVPYGITGSTVSVVVKYQGVPSDPLLYRLVAAAPGIFTISGDAAIVRFGDNAIINTSTPASPNDILQLFAEGAGVAAPPLGDGTIIGTTLPIPAATTTVLIDGTTVVQPTYAGGAPGDVNGVLQVNFVVPAQLKPGPHQIQLQMVSGGTTYTSPTGVNLQTK